MYVQSMYDPRGASRVASHGKGTTRRRFGVTLPHGSTEHGHQVRWQGRNEEEEAERP